MTKKKSIKQVMGMPVGIEQLKAAEIYERENPSRPYVHPNIRTVWNYKLGDEPKDLEKVDPVSLTVPDMTMSLKQLIERHARGLPVPTLGNPQYSETEFPDLARLDLAQVQELKEQNLQYMEDLQAEIKLMEDEIRNRKNPPPTPPNPQNDDLPPEVV